MLNVQSLRTRIKFWLDINYKRYLHVSYSPSITSWYSGMIHMVSNLLVKKEKLSILDILLQPLGA